jgi:hypothetical protein
MMLMLKLLEIKEIPEELDSNNASFRPSKFLAGLPLISAALS